MYKLSLNEQKCCHLKLFVLKILIFRFWIIARTIRKISKYASNKVPSPSNYVVILCTDQSQSIILSRDQRTIKGRKNIVKSIHPSLLSESEIEKFLYILNILCSIDTILFAYKPAFFVK